MSEPAAPILEARGLVKSFPSRDGRGTVRAVDDVSIRVGSGETLGIVGESGSGKSTLGRLLLRLIEADGGDIRFLGDDLGQLSAKALRGRRRDMQIVFQDPYASLDPRMTVGALIAEPLVIHRIGDHAERRRRVGELIEMVGLDAAAAERFPHQFSGGQRQRIGIARAIALSPKLLVLDEPVSALDVSIQSQILNLLLDLKERLQLSYVFISHDLSVVRHVSDRVAVLYLGQIVEVAPTDLLFAAPAHPYTQALLAAIPGAGSSTALVAGEPPSPEAPPSGCRFHPRCPRAFAPCSTVPPPLFFGGQPGGQQLSRCHLASGTVARSS